ncbi:MAG: type II toxin-antitoxin system VapC family toxin [Ignavibacteriaceae bacterium]
MKKIRVYVDTSVFGGVFDDEFKKASSIFFEQVRLNFFEVFVSPIVGNEISLAPQQVQDFYAENLPQTKIMDISDEALKLRDAYLNAKIISKKYSNDALHVALATVSGCSIIVSWNFKHIVHFEKIALYNAINISEGYQQISIYSPLEVISYE